MASAKQAIKLLKSLGYTLFSVKASGAQVWARNGHSVCVPVKSEVAESLLKTARRHADAPAPQRCAVHGCHEAAASFSNKCSHHWQAQAHAFPQGL
jgi:predicted RNA binding protein YcfA (HicA-like mRNA interferase family)